MTEPAPGILANDTDGNSDPLTAALVTDVVNGTLALNADGSFTYSPDADFEGTDTFTYLANDGSADSNTATVTITVTHANESPVAVDDAYTTDEDIPLVVSAPGVLGNDTDFESDPLTAVVDTAPANGTLVLNADGSFTYTPNPDFNGTDTFTYHANDGLSDSNAATVSITVDAVNDVPSFTVGPDETVLEGAGAQTVNPWATGISPGPADESGQTVSFNVTGNTDPALFSAGPAVSAAGVLTYTPAADASGSATITLTLADDGGTANGGVDTSAAQTFTITVNSVNDAPSFVSGGNVTVLEDAGAQAVAWAAGISPGPANEAGQTLSFNITGNTNPALFVTGPAVSSSGVLTFTPLANAFGNATIMLVLQDNGGTANGGVDTSAPPQSFTITVTAINDPPAVTPPAAYAVHAHIGINIPNGATDLFDGSSITDVDGLGAQPFSITATGPFASANGGSVTIAANGSFTYNPPVGFTGANDTFTYQICDSGVPGSACTNATATVAVSGPRVWFVNNALGSSGDGRLSSPFNTLAAADTAASANGDRIFAFTGASNYTGGFVLFTNQRLIGQGVVDTGFDAALGVTPPATSVARPAINGTRPTINGTVTVGANNTVRGLNIVTNGATGLTGNTFGTLTASEVSVTGDNEAAISLVTGNLAATFTSISSTGGSVPGINLSGTTGTFTVTGNAGTCTSAATCTGGSIANKTGSSEATGTPGVRLFNVTNFRLTRMNISSNNHSAFTAAWLPILPERLMRARSTDSSSTTAT